MYRHLITLIEHNFAHTHVWHATSKECAKHLVQHGIDVSRHGSPIGPGFCVGDTPATARTQSYDWTDEDGVVLEYIVNDEFRILDLDDDEQDRLVWHHERHRLPKILVHHGIDGASLDHNICIYNPDALRFVRVYSGVIDDPLSQTDTGELDEFALGGLKRCTAVTVNALLKYFHIPGILLSDVPVDNPGVLAIIDRKGLAYKPYLHEAGKTVQQFVSTHLYGVWYLLTPGHAMALVNGELFDAENKGADGRKLQAAYQITRR